MYAEPHTLNKSFKCLRTLSGMDVCSEYYILPLFSIFYFFKAINAIQDSR